MNIISRRKRLLNRTLRAPKMSSRRQFHRALRRHPAWPMVMEQAAARAWTQESVKRNRASVIAKGTAPNRAQFRRALRRNRVGVVALIAAGASVALLNGIGAAIHGEWIMMGEGTPPIRFGAATAFDGTRGQMLIFGGFSGAAPPSLPPNLADTWSYESAGQYNGKWINRNPVHRPSPRGFASMAYDEARNNVVLFGGGLYQNTSLPGAVFGETWTWDGSDWTLREPPGPRPDARKNASMVYDVHRKVVVLFGGRGANGNSLDDTWVWNGSAWKKLSTEGGPSSRHSAAMAHDLCRGEAVMFGGVPSPLPTGFASTPGETWTWNGTKWTQKAPTSTLSPTRRIGGGMAYSHENGRVMLYGGLTSIDSGQSQVATDENLWMWDGSGWEKETANLADAVLANTAGGWRAGNPPPRAYASFVHDRTKGILQLFGGTPSDYVAVGISSVLPQIALPDQWTFNLGHENNGCKNPVPIPSDGAAPVDDQSGDKAAKLRKVETRDEVREIGRLPVLLGPIRNPIQNPNKPQETPQPPCIRRENAENVGNTHLATDPKRNKVYQFFFCDPQFNDGSNKKVLIQAYDGTTFKPLGSAIASIKFVNAEIPAFDQNTVMHDPERGRFILTVGTQDLFVIQQDLIENKTNPVVKEIALPAGTPRIPGTTPPGIRSMSFFNHPKTGRAKMLVYYKGSKSPESNPVEVLQFDLDGNREDWRRSIEVCDSGGIETTGRGWPNLAQLMRTEDRVYMSCNLGNGQYGVVRIPIAEGANGSETVLGTLETFPGPYSVSRTWGDPKAERMLLLSDTFYGAVLWVFDGRATRYVGRIAVDINSTTIFGSNNGFGFGFDQETGRLYVLVRDSGDKAQGGLRILDTRLTPVPQAENFGQFSYSAQAIIGVLPPESGLPRRVFVRRASTTTPSDPDDPKQTETGADSIKRYPDNEDVKLRDEMHYLVLADLLSVPKQPEVAQLDVLTVPVAEAPGKTEVSFEAEGNGYGIRLRSVRGIASALQTPPQMGGNSLNTEFNPPCYYPDKELVAGWVSYARLSDLETSARSSGLEVDSSSKVDLEGPSSRCGPRSPTDSTLVPPSIAGAVDTLWSLIPFTQFDGAVGPQLKWDKHFKEVECVGDSSNTNQATLGDVYGSANCKQKEARVEGTARGAALGSATAGYSVGEGYSNVALAREPARGVVVTSTAVAKAIKVGPISIDLVKTEAVSWSSGRPSDKPRVSFTRTICGVTFPPPGPTNSGCLNEDQQKQMVDNFNARMGVNAKMTRPLPDPSFFKGSPGGYIAGVTKLQAEEVEDQFFARDSQKEVPGLQIVFYKDSLSEGPGRQVLQLAGVRGVTSFGVQCNSDLIYSSSAKDCVALSFEDDPVEFGDDSGDEGGFSSGDDTEFDSDGGWTPVEATGAPGGLALGQRLGRIIENLPIVRLLPIRQMGEALLAGSVWLLLGLPLLFAGRRLTINLGRNN